ncbi:MAG TPA: phospholipase D-like domain-containing protein [Terriglobia bacterium]|nr:phospholipase D-like domain-containing protein [Terriglobia bacterium]
MNAEVLFTSSVRVAPRIEGLLGEATRSIDCALYRLGNTALAKGLRQATHRGVRVRVVLDRGKVREGLSHRELLKNNSVSCRLSSGRSGGKSKMHHKFAVLDDSIALTGSYNWSEESEEDNYENLVILRESALVDAYIQEFDLLWQQASDSDADAR